MNIKVCPLIIGVLVLDWRSIAYYGNHDVVRGGGVHVSFFKSYLACNLMQTSTTVGRGYDYNDSCRATGGGGGGGGRGTYALNNLV